MPSIVITFLLLPPLFLYAGWICERRDRHFVLTTVLVSWLLMAPSIALIDAWMSFSGSGDDELYFELAATTAASASDLFNIARFTGLLEQPGFPWLLSIVSALVGHDVVALKLFNLSILIANALTWYRIATLLESFTLARVVLLGTLLLSPLWFYAMFLRKDLIIVLLQSLFLLGLVTQWRSGGFAPWLLVGASTLALLPFRTPLIAQNAAVLISALVLRELSHGRRGGSRVLAMLIGISIVVGLVLVGTSPDAVESFGVSSADRILGSMEMSETIMRAGDSSVMNRALFPFTYLLTETRAFRPDSWDQLNAPWLRGALALPWIALVVPFFVVGALWLLRPLPSGGYDRGEIGRLRRCRLISTPWGILALFSLSTALISWQVGDTVRWRLSDMPVIATISMAGWVYTSSRLRCAILLAWLIGAAPLLMLFVLNKAG